MAKPTFEPLSCFVLRAPALPFDAIASWGDDPRAALAHLVADPVVREALYVASPDLDAQIAAWQREPASPAGQAVERALVRYLSRMAARATPFGLFSAVAVGAVGATTQLAIAPRARATRHTRLDNDVLFALCSALARDPAVRARLRYRPSSSLYTAAARLRYAEARLAGATRAYHLVAVDRSGYLDALLARADAGATLDELADVLCADPDIARDEALAFVGEVIDAQLLVPELAPAVTGKEPADAIVATLEACGLADRAAPLRAAGGELGAIDAAPPGVPADRYQAIERRLAGELPVAIEPARLFQIDLFRPGDELALGTAVIDELRRGIELLHALAPAADDPWALFRQRFAARYETREVPLLEVLDADIGIGFGDPEHSPRAAPLLADLALPARFEPRRAPFGARDARLTALVTHALQAGARELVLSDDDIEQLSRPARPPLPDTVCAHAVLIAASARAVDAGDFQLRLSGVGGGATLLGRFCHGSPDVAALTAECLRAEEALHPDAVFAEVVHLPEGRIGNVIARPVLRAYEIPYLGASGADREHQLDVADLVVSVAGDRVVLRSRRLGREVLPRLTTAHNYTARSLAVYRFLCALATQGRGDAYWSWGPLDALPFLPRVRRGRLVLARARWLLERQELAPLAKGPGALDELRARRALPRWVVLADGDNELAIDLDNSLMADSLCALLHKRPAATLYELLPGPDQLCARGPEGSFAHELVVLFARAPEPTAARATPPPPRAQVARRFLPGSSWLSLKLYTGTATADALLRDELAPAIAGIVAGGLANGWFFLRYADPDWHVRLRFTGDPRVLAGDVLPRLHDALAPACERGLLWRIVVDTYEREVERYGGAEGIVLAERLFCADSAAALAIVDACRGDAGADQTWRLALVGIDRLLDDLGLDLPAKLRLATDTRDALGAEVGMDTALQRALGDKFRKHRGELARLLDTGHPALAARSRRLAPIAELLHALARGGRLGQPIEQLAQSYVHMHVNRVIRTSQRLHELVLHDLLRRHYDGLVARAKKQSA